jgi:chitinase
MKMLRTNQLWRIGSFILLLIFLSTVFISARLSSKEEGPVIIGYVGGFRGETNTDIIDARKLTHINYAFVNVQGNRAFLTNERTDTIIFEN